MTEPEIKILDLNVYYGKHHILKNITVKIPRNQITTIIGPSGCGKTTLLKSFNRLIDLTDDVKVKGNIIVDGISVYDHKLDVTLIRKKMGLLSQKPCPLPLSIYDNVAYGPRIHGEKDLDKLDKIVEHYLRTVGLWNEVKNRLDEPASQLSVGQQQRLCLARGLAVEPEIILCDEPTSALDPISAQRIEKLLLKLKSKYTVVLVTHTLRQAKRVADYVIFLYFGKLIEHGPSHMIFNNPTHKKTIQYMKGIVG